MQWHTPIGYKVLNGKIVIYEEHRKIVEQIFRDYDSGVSALRIAKDLKDRGVKNAHDRVGWSHASMNKSAVTRKKNQKSKFSSEYALTGLLLCGDCGQEYRRVTWSRNGKKKIVWRCSNRLTNGTKHCKKSETLEEVALNRAVMEAINRIARGDGDFVGAFRQNVIRVIGSYGGEQEPDEYDEKIKEKEEEMVALIAENARVGSYTDEFDERYRRIAEEINTLKEEQIETRRKKKLADSYEQRLKDMDSFMEKQTCQIPEFDNDLVRRLIASIKIVSAEKLIIQFQSGIVMEQEIRYE